MPSRRADPKLASLQTVPLFESFRKRDLQSLARIADEIDLPAGKELIREGERGRQFFVLLEGEAVVRRRGRRVNLLRSGDFFGEISLLTDRETTATVTTTAPSRLLVITRPNFSRLVRDAPAVQWSLIQTLVKRVPVD